MIDVTITFSTGCEQTLLCSDVVLQKDSVILFAYNDRKKQEVITYNWDAIDTIKF